MNDPYPRTQPNIIGTGMTIAPASMESAVCAQVDPELFFPQKGGLTSEAKRICAGCTVAAQCLDYALNLGYGATGIWGGTSTAERREILGRRQAPQHLTEAQSRPRLDPNQPCPFAIRSDQPPVADEQGLFEVTP